MMSTEKKKPYVLQHRFSVLDILFPSHYSYCVMMGVELIPYREGYLWRDGEAKSRGYTLPRHRWVRRADLESARLHLLAPVRTEEAQ